MISKPYTLLTTYNTWTITEKENETLNAKGLNILFCALSYEQFSKVSAYKSPYEVWHALEVSHEGTSQVKETKINMLIHKYELFKMHEDENVSEMFSSFLDIINSLKCLGKNFE